MQTILAILAMLIVTLMSIGQQRALTRLNQDMLDDEMEVMASGVALQVVEYIAAKKFDQNAPVPLTGAANQFRAPGSFPTNKRCDVTPPIQTSGGGYSNCTVVEDFHKMKWEVVPFPTRNGTVEFEVQAQIRYLNDQAKPTNSQTYNKEITVTVRERIVQGRPALLRNPVVLSRTLSYKG